MEPKNKKDLTALFLKCLLLDSVWTVNMHANVRIAVVYVLCIYIQQLAAAMLVSSSHFAEGHSVKTLLLDHGLAIGGMIKLSYHTENQVHAQEWCH